MLIKKKSHKVDSECRTKFHAQLSVFDIATRRQSIKIFFILTKENQKTKGQKDKRTK